ncbi:MAG TPA: thioether cross-link-forming SCIFF peptide maturase [Candidatus Faecaligallichristensenella faecipullorum]|nr:thioether cross-link-forming SCIFF peptide maturase [Candidatus Faecaligallichristensenella faecipullorum]
MLHLFKACGVYMALDVLSGAVHLLDEMAYDVLKLKEEKQTDAQIIEALKGKYPEEELREVLGEIGELVAQGALMAEHDYTGLQNQSGGVVKAMCLHAAHDCNLRCKYCFASTGDFHGPRGLLPVETGKRALDWLVRHSGNRKQLEVDFFGGEPLMNFEAIKEIVAYGRSLEKETGKHFQFTTTTNAVNLTEEVGEFLNKEMYNVVLSIDGRKEIHDFMRPAANGKGSYDVVLPKMQAFRKSRGDKSYYVRGTFTNRNLDFSNDVISLADNGFDQISIEPVVLEKDSPFALSEEMLPRILAEYDKLAEIYLDRRKNGRWFNFFHFNIDLEGGPCIRKRLTGCGAGNEYVAVTPEGDIYPCHQFVGREGFKMGSVLTDEFNTDLQAKFAANHVLSKEKCSECWARFYCSGGCAANAHAFHGDISKPYELECEMERKRLECAMAIYAIEHMK